MYKYSDFDEAFVRDRVEVFRGQVARRIDGSLTEDEFKPLRLMNGLYLQLHAYMLRVAVPYGTMNPVQMRGLRLMRSRTRVRQLNCCGNGPRIIRSLPIYRESSRLRLRAHRMIER